MFRKLLLRLVLILVLLALIGGGVYYWHYLSIYVSTDDAYVSGYVGMVAAQVPGRTAKVLVDNNDYVKQGQVLVILDPKDYQVAVAHAEAALNSLRQDLASRYAKVTQAQGEIAQAQAQLKHAITDLNRYGPLYERRVVPKQKLDQVTTQYKVYKATLEQAQGKEREALAAIGGSTSIPINEQPAIKEAKARLEQARLNLSYTEVKAHIDGFITKRSVEVGNWVQPGQPLMALVPLRTSDLWIEANYKETQLTHVCIGQPADVEVDTYPGVKFKGRVDSIMAGTGAAFTLLPPENATGNWVKVVQRVPVKIVLLPPFPENKPLRLGMSSIVTIDTRDRSGPKLLGSGKLGSLRPDNPPVRTPTPLPAASATKPSGGISSDGFGVGGTKPRW
jgi:membrane fusion protein (multidrug efflux system)